jgi:hypothetical protein
MRGLIVRFRANLKTWWQVGYALHELAFQYIAPPAPWQPVPRRGGLSPWSDASSIAHTYVENCGGSVQYTAILIGREPNLNHGGGHSYQSLLLKPQQISPHADDRGLAVYERIGVLKVLVGEEFSFEESDWFLQASLEDIIIC